VGSRRRRSATRRDVPAGREAHQDILALDPALGFIAIPRPLGVGISGPFALVGVASLIATIVYLVDVRPAVRTYSGRRGRRGRSAGDRGGW
jgi:hypothetical protein